MFNCYENGIHEHNFDFGVRTMSYSSFFLSQNIKKKIWEGRKNETTEVAI